MITVVWDSSHWIIPTKTPQWLNRGGIRTRDLLPIVSWSQGLGRVRWLPLHHRAPAQPAWHIIIQRAIMWCQAGNEPKLKFYPALVPRPSQEKIENLKVLVVYMYVCMYVTPQELQRPDYLEAGGPAQPHPGSLVIFSATLSHMYTNYNPNV